MVIATPVESETKNNAPGPAPKPKEFFGNLGDMFSKFGKNRGGKKAENKTAPAEGGLVDGIFGEVKKTLDGATDGIKKTGEAVSDVQSKIGKMFSGDGFKGISKMMGKDKTNGAEGSSADGIGSMVSGILQMALPGSKENLTLADFGIPQK